MRFLLAILALAPATVLMGATLPTLTRFLSTGQAGIGKAFQQLYAANTIGAILGTAIAGFALIELFGLTGALLVGAACSATAGVVALLLDRWVRRGERAATTAAAARPRRRRATEPVAAPVAAPRRRRRLPDAIAAASR